MGILTISEGGLPLSDQWITQLEQLNRHLKKACSEEQIGTVAERRRFLQESVGKIRSMFRLEGPALKNALGGGLLVGVDGTVNSFGIGFPHYLDFIRAMAKPSSGEAIILKELHCPLSMSDPGPDAQRNDNELRQRKLAELELQAALAAVERFRPALVLMDGPLVRFEMRAPILFGTLRRKVLNQGVLLLGCIENIESKVLVSVLGDQVPPGWSRGYDRDLLWGVLDYGEVLEVMRPAKGTYGLDSGGAQQEATPIRTWFLRASLEPGVVGVDMLDEQAEQMATITDLLFTLSPPDGRGIPIWLDLVDREVRLTNVELEAYLQLLDSDLRRFFVSKRDARSF